MKDLRARRRVVVLAGIVLLANAPAWAQSLAPDSEAQVVELLDEQGRPWMEGVSMEARRSAREVFLHGNQLIQDALFAKAAARYKEALALWDHPAIHYNLAIAQINLEQPIEAAASLERAMRHGPGPLGQNKYEHAQSYRKLLAGQLAHIEVRCDEPGAEVTLDGVRLFTGPGRQRVVVRPGGHQVMASKPRHWPATRQVVLAPEDHARVELSLLTLDEVAESNRRWAAWKPWAVVGTGAALAMVGGVVQWRGVENVRSFDRKFLLLPCVTDPDMQRPGCPREMVPAELTQQLRRAEWQQRIAATTYVAGGLVIATGLVLVYVNQPRLPGKEDRDRPGRVAVTPVVSAHSIGAMAGVRF